MELTALPRPARWRSRVPWSFHKNSASPSCDALNLNRVFFIVTVTPARSVYYNVWRAKFAFDTSEVCVTSLQLKYNDGQLPTVPARVVFARSSTATRWTLLPSCRQRQRGSTVARCRVVPRRRAVAFRRPSPGHGSRGCPFPTSADTAAPPRSMRQSICTSAIAADDVTVCAVSYERSDSCRTTCRYV